MGRIIVGGQNVVPRRVVLGDGGAGKVLKRVVYGNGGSGIVLWSAGRVMSIVATYSSPNNVFTKARASGDTSIVYNWSDPAVSFSVPVTCNRPVVGQLNSTTYPVGVVVPARTYIKPTDWGVTFTFTEAL